MPDAPEPASELVVGEDGRARCGWGASTPDYRVYHDEEWGRPVHGADALFERLCLEAFQSGLSWLTILRKRPAFRAAFADFEIAAVAEFGERDVERLLGDAGIVRNRAKIEAAIANAKAAREIDDLSGADLVLRARPGHAAGAALVRRRARGHARVDGAGQGAQAARLPLRRADDRVRADAGVRARERPPRRLLRALMFERLRPAGTQPPHEWLAELSAAERAPDDRPFVYLNMVASVDGRAAIDGGSHALGSDADTLLLTELRTLADAVLIGTGTLRAEGYGRLVGNPERVARREAAGRPATPLAVLISRSLDLPWDAGLFAARRPAGGRLHRLGRGAAGRRRAARGRAGRRRRRPPPPSATCGRGAACARCCAKAGRRSTARCSRRTSSTSSSSRSRPC